jgi:hypothetical protein
MLPPRHAPPDASALPLSTCRSNSVSAGWTVPSPDSRATPAPFVQGFALAVTVAPHISVMRSSRNAAAPSTRGLHSTFQLRVNVSTFYWIRWVVTVTKTAQNEVRSGRVEAPVRPKHSCAQPFTFWPNVSTFCGDFSDKKAQVEVRSGRGLAPAIHPTCQDRPLLSPRRHHLRRLAHQEDHAARRGVLGGDAHRVAYRLQPGAYTRPLLSST